MKKLLIECSAVCLLILIIFMTSTCERANLNKHRIYQPGKEYAFIVHVYDKDSLVRELTAVYKTLDEMKFFRSLGQWSYEYVDIGQAGQTKKSYTLTSIVTETNDEIKLQLPGGEIFRMLEDAPYPHVLLPPEQNDTWKTRSMFWKVSEIKDLEINGKKYHCQVIDANSTTDHGNITARYFFNDSLGFVRMIIMTNDRKKYDFMLNV